MLPRRLFLNQTHHFYPTCIILTPSYPSPLDHIPHFTVTLKPFTTPKDYLLIQLPHQRLPRRLLFLRNANFDHTCIILTPSYPSIINLPRYFTVTLKPYHTPKDYLLIQIPHQRLPGRLFLTQSHHFYPFCPLLSLHPLVIPITLPLH
jgi:hypothetical protein